MSIVKKEKRDIRTEKLVYNDGTVVHIKRVTRDKLSDLYDLQKELWEIYINANLSFASLMMDDEAVQNMEETLLMLPTIEGEPVDFSKLEDDYEQLARIFCSRSYNDDGTYDPLVPSIIASLHHFDYTVTLGKLMDKKRIAEEQASGQGT